jgi:hypothetical protein
MNNLIGNVRLKAASGMEMALRAGCIARTLGSTLPATVGETLDLADAANAALGNHIDKLSFSKMTIKLAAEGVFETEVEATDPHGVVWTRVTQKRSSATESEGIVLGVFTPSTAAALQGGAPEPDAENHAFSVMFKESGTSITYDATQSRVEADEIAASKADVFESDHRVRVASTGRPGYDHVMTTMDDTTLAGETVYLWTAGDASEEQRVMHVKVTGEGDERTGLGYFGFGDTLDSFRAAVKAGTVATDATSISKMICNWAGPEHSHDGTSNVQKQVLKFEPTTGYFQAQESHIGYAAQNDCGATAEDAAFTWSPKKNATRPDDSKFQPWPKYDLPSLDDEKANLTLPSLISVTL